MLPLVPIAGARSTPLSNLMRFLSSGPRRWGLLLVSLVTLGTCVLIPGCSNDPQGLSGEGGFTRLDLSPTGGPLEFPQMKDLGRWNDFQRGKEHADWIVRGSKVQIREFDGQEILRIDRKKADVIINIPVDIEIDQSCVMNALVVVRGKTVPMVASVFEGNKKVGSALVKVDSSPDLRGVPFQIKLDGGAKVHATKIALKIPKGDTPFMLRSLSLKQGALGMELGPKVFGDYDLVDIGGNARRATALNSESDMAAKFQVRTEFDVLRFSYARQAELVREGQEVTLKVKLVSGSESSEHEFGFDNVLWHHGEIELDDYVGQDVTATWSLASSKGLAMCVLGQPRHATVDPEANTVLMVTSDTHRSDHLGFLMEEGELQTEAIDRLAAEGVVFLDAVSSVNNTTPSHVSLFTGLSPRDTGIVANAKRLSDAAPTLAEAFRDSGYITLASVSASPVNYKLCGLGQGFDRYSIPPKKGVRRSNETLGNLMDWIPNYDGEPVFMWLHIYDAHGPYDPPDEMKRMYYDGERDPFDATVEGADIKLSPYWNKEIADPDYTEALYKSEITYLDRGLGDLFNLPRVDRGIIAFTSDHGEVLRHGPGDPFDHRGLSLNTLAVPMIFKAPSLQGGGQRNDPVLQIDVGRTLLNLAGLEHMPFPGRDVLRTTLEPGELRFAMQANGISASVLTDKWMLDLNLRVPGSADESKEELFHSVELYDIVSDRFCQNNVWEANREKAATLRRAVIRWLEQSKTNEWESEALISQEDINKELADLGYVTVEDSTATEWFDSECECQWCEKFAE